MKKIFFALMALTVVIVIFLFTSKVSAAPTAMLTPTLGSPTELAQLKVCKAAGAGVTV